MPPPKQTHTHPHSQTDGQSNNIIPLAISIGWVEASTSSSATADGPRDVMCQSKFCQLLQNSVRTSCTTNPEQIEAMVLEGYSRRMGRRHQRSRRLPVNLVNHPVIQGKPEMPPADRIHEQNEQDPSRCSPAPSSIRQQTKWHHISSRSPKLQQTRLSNVKYAKDGTRP